MSNNTFTRRQAAMVGLTGLVAAVASPAKAAQPHMEAALSALNTALGELEAAVADKGGHRLKAIADVRGAIAQTQLGINFANGH